MSVAVYIVIAYVIVGSLWMFHQWRRRRTTPEMKVIAVEWLRAQDPDETATDVWTQAREPDRTVLAIILEDDADEVRHGRPRFRLIAIEASGVVELPEDDERYTLRGIK